MFIDAPTGGDFLLSVGPERAIIRLQISKGPAIMPYFAVIDTETNWVDQVMSIGTVIADAETFRPVAAKYHILPAYCEVGGMYYDALPAGGGRNQTRGPYQRSSA